MAKTTTAPPETHVTIDVARPTALTKDAAKLAMTAGLLARITTKQQADDAAHFVRGVRERARRIKAHYLDVRRPLNKAIDDIRAMEKADLAPWEAADKTVSAPLLAWTIEQEQAAKAENARRLASAEDVARREREAQAAAIRDAAKAAPTKAAARSLERQAKEVEKAPLLPVALDAVDAPKLDGVSVPKRAHAEVVDFGLLVQAVANGRVSLDALSVNHRYLDGLAMERGKDLNVPGVVYRETPTLSARGL